MAQSNVLSDHDILLKEPELIAGPGADPDRGTAPRPLLEGASEYEYVDLMNPLSVEFIGMFGVSRPTTAPISITPVQGRGVTQNEADLRQGYGLDLRNPDHQGRANIVNRISIKSGATVRLLGNEAQVVVRQLVNEIMAREDHKLLLSDAHARREVEQRVIITRGNVADYLGQAPKTVSEQLQAVKEANHDEDQFPGLNNAGTVAELDQKTSGNNGSLGQPGIRIKDTSAKTK